VPEKAVWLAFELGELDEFQHHLGEKLGKTITEIEDMPHREYIRWYVYFGRKAQRAELAAKRKG
jgi:hypothetical protein